MSVPQRFIDMFGGLAKVPQYIKNHFRDRAERRRELESAKMWAVKGVCSNAGA